MPCCNLLLSLFLFAFITRNILTKPLGIGTEAPVDHLLGFVHVKDVALAHILLYENTSATGRHLCVQAASHYNDLAARIGELYPEYKLPRYEIPTS